jgi:hypothetical protein
MSADGSTECARAGCARLTTPQPGPRPRRYCSDACRQAAYRARLTTREAAAATLAAWAALEPAPAGEHERENA